MTNILKEHNVDLILLIGFMRILSSTFCRNWAGKILNVHPPSFRSMQGMDTNVHEEVLKNNDKETGCTIHLVTDEVDGGPIIIQKKCKVDSNDTIDSLKSKVQSLEGEAFLEAIPCLQTMDKKHVIEVNNSFQDTMMSVLGIEITTLARAMFLENAR